MSSVSDIIANQQQIAGAIENLHTNFKKDSSSRKTPDYIKRKLDILDNYWFEYENNYKKLVISDIDASTRDFIDQEFEKVKEKYGNTRAHIQNYQPSVEERPRTPILKPPTLLPQSSEAMKVDGGSSTSIQQSSRMSVSKTEEMLRKQQSNLRAFHRTIQGINLDYISEKWELEDLLRTIYSRWVAIDSLHWDLDSELNGSNQEYERTFSAYEEKYASLKKAINKKMSSVAHMENSTPKMDIPTFTGNYNYWVSFKDLFKETIHHNPSMSNAQKMQYLRSKVRGEAEKLIQHLHVSSENYNVCWDILNQRYNNIRLIFTSHMHTLMNIPTMQQQSLPALKRMHDTTTECINAIKNLGVDVQAWDPILVYILTQKLDTESYMDYMESVKNPRELPVLSELLQFLELKFTTLEASRRKQDHPVQKNQVIAKSNNNQRPSYYKNAFSSSSKIITKSSPPSSSKKVVSAKCSLCNNNEHGIYFCKNFIDMSPYNRLKTVTKLSLCPNCLHNHHGQECISERYCRECKQDHNTLLHEALTPSARPTTSSGAAVRGGSTLDCSNANDAKQVRSSTHVSLQSDTVEVLLPTAMIQIQAADGSYYIMRALLDQGSQTSLITESAAQLLRLPRKKCIGIISGIGDKESNGRGMINIKCRSMINDFSFETDALVMRQLIKNLPSQSFNCPDWSYLDQIKLADPEFYTSRPVDVLLGADVYSTILMDGICKSKSTLPTAQQTQLGWILSGNARTFQCNVVLHNQDLEEIQKFWQIEDIVEESDLTTEDQHCIEFYKSTTTRLENGRYEVRLPLKPDYQEKLGQSKSKAIAQFNKLEQKFTRNVNFANDYKSFINEYLLLGHMTPADSSFRSKCYLPHHGVTRAESSTTKLRVVFNASEKTSTGFSLNDVMYRGPNLQQDLQSLLIKWRQYRYAFTADLEKMFRFIGLNEHDQNLQVIVWRDDPRSPLKEYNLATVTYGTKAAPFLAMMTLKQLANDEKGNYQDSSAPFVLENSFYMDDLIHGCSSIESAKKLQQDLTKLLKSGGFNLRKWKSNSPKLLEDVDVDQKQQESFRFKQAETTKALGLRWCPQDDYFTFQPNIESKFNTKPTKRVLLSELSQLFDPLGWLAPFTVKLKLLFQDVWKANISWDETVPKRIIEEWQNLKAHLQVLGDIKIPRWIQTEDNDSIELHGFCDASTKAYAAVVYIKIRRENTSKITLVAAKTKVVPLNKNTSLPRLELCGAVLLAKLISKIKTCLENHNIIIYGWVDSMAVLGWLNGDTSRWKSFVANRVKQVTDSVPSECWRYVKSKENPADCASRGLTAPQLRDHTLWRHGPQWLLDYKPEKNIETSYSTNEEIKIIKQVNIIQLSSGSEIIERILTITSSLFTAIRILARILRWSSKKSRSTYLTLQELNYAKLKITKIIQEQYFSDEINKIRKGDCLSTTSKLCSLNPILDDNGLLRVGGRLRQANLDPEMKHPIIIPNSRLAELIINQAHTVTCHGGARLTTAFIRKRYWILGGVNATKKQLRLCVICKKNSQGKQQQIMGDLPSARTNPSRPFYHCGVDYTGHVNIKANKGRGIKTTKGYVAVFVCMATKAVHLELVSDLSTSAFLAALRRMSARRGVPGHMYSDQGTNFIGARNVLQQELEQLQHLNDQAFLTEIAGMGLEWHFNAPSWPSAGGLWEAAVKSLKHHLKRVVGEQHLTFEEFTTILSHLEGCLNSRPLCPITEDPDDLNFLTPAHFLASGPVLTLYDTEKDLRTRWYLTQKIFGDVWRRWRDEYLTQLSSRSKWRKPRENIKLDDVVVIKDDNLPPGKWSLGRVIELHPGSDGYVRVVTLKTKNGLMKRPVIKLSVLPVHHDVKEVPEIKKDNQAIEPQQESTPKKLTKKKCNVSTLAATLLLFLFTIPPIQCLYKTTLLPSNNSIYFDHVTNMNLIRDEWRLIVYYDTQPYQDGSAAIDMYLKYLQHICSKIRQQSHCENIMLQLRHEVTELQYYDNILLNHHSTVPSRSKRGLINGVGSIANSLFGVLDEKFAEKYEKDIYLIRENENHLASLWKNQTSVVEAEFNLLKRTESIIDKQHKLINKKINTVEKSIEFVQTEVQNISLSNEFIATAMLANNVIFSLKDIQQTLLDAVTNIYNGKFNFHLLTPLQLRHELRIITEQLPKDMAVPIKKNDNLAEIYNLLRVQARVTTSFIIFEIKIPLIAEETYEIMRLIPVPHLTINQTDIIIQPISSFVAVNLKQDLYITLEEEDLKLCIPKNTLTTLCHIKKPIYIINNDHNFCEVLPYTNICKTITKPCTNRWIQLNKPNNYFYFCCQQCQLKLICDDQVTPLQLSHAGFFNVNQACILKSADFFIYSERHQQSKIEIKSELTLPEISQLNYLLNISLPKISETNQSEFDQLSYQQDTIQSDIDIMKQEQPLTERVSYHDVHHYAAIYVLFAVVGIIVITLLWRRIKGSTAAAATAGPAAEPAARAPAAHELAPASTRERCTHHYSEISELNKNRARVSLKNKGTPSTVPSAIKRVLVKDVGSSPIVHRPVFNITADDNAIS